MTEPLVAITVVFVFGFLAGMAFLGGLIRATRSEKRTTRASPVSPRARTARSRAFSERLAALERAVAVAEPPVARRSAVGAVRRSVSDPDALDALVALGYPRREAAARLTALPDGLTTTEQRVRAALTGLASPQ